eukprot:11588211-Alexandrium_andersonii.AAC.1
MRRASIRRLRPGPPRPRDRAQVLKLPAAPALRQGSPGHPPHLTDLCRTNRRDVGGGTPTPAEPNPRLPAG